MKKFIIALIVATALSVTSISYGQTRKTSLYGDTIYGKQVGDLYSLGYVNGRPRPAYGTPKEIAAYERGLGKLINKEMIKIRLFSRKVRIKANMKLASEIRSSNNPMDSLDAVLDHFSEYQRAYDTLNLLFETPLRDLVTRQDLRKLKDVRRGLEDQVKSLRRVFDMLKFTNKSEQSRILANLVTQ